MEQQSKNLQRLSKEGASMPCRVRAALAAAPGHRLQGYRLAAAAGISTRDFNKRAAEMVARGYISREKVRDAGHAYYWYSLDAAQLHRARLVAALSSAEATVTGALVVEEVDLPGRLNFLRMLREQTVFAGHQVLAAIIEDYERTARLRRAAAAGAAAESAARRCG